MSNSLSQSAAKTMRRGVEARQGGIERVRIVAQPDAQMALGEGCAGNQRKGEGQGGSSGLSVSWCLRQARWCALHAHAIRAFHAAEA